MAPHFVKPFVELYQTAAFVPPSGRKDGYFKRFLQTMQAGWRAATTRRRSAAPVGKQPAQEALAQAGAEAVFGE